MSSLDLVLGTWTGLALSAPVAFVWLARAWVRECRIKGDPEVPGLAGTEAPGLGDSATPTGGGGPRPPSVPVSIIKPIRGATPELLENLRSALRTGYPGTIELLCCIETDDDPARVVIEELIAGESQSDVRLVVSHGEGSIFGKHANLMAGYREARYATVAFSDADVVLPMGILEEAVMGLERPGIGGSSVVFFQDWRGGIATEVMAMFVAVYGVTPNLAARYLRMLPNAIGALMVYRKSEIEALGGLPSIIADKISDDGALGVAVRSTGKELHFCCQPCLVVHPESSVGSVMRNIHRWQLMFKGQGPSAYAQMLLVNAWFPWSLWVLASLLGVSDWSLARLGMLAVAIWSWESLVGAWTLKSFHPRFSELPPLVVWGRPVAELMLAATWLWALVWPWTEWGGRRYYVPLGGRAKLVGRGGW